MNKELQIVNFGTTGEVRVSHRNLAEYMGLRQDNIRKLVEDNIVVFEQISHAPFQMEHVNRGFGGEQEIKVYYLDSDQTNLLIALTRNTEITIELKANVIKSFKQAKNLLKITNDIITDEQRVMINYKFKIDNACSIANLLGYSQGWQRKEALEIGVKLESDSGYELIPTFLLDDPEANNPTMLSEYDGTHAAMVPRGTHGSKVTIIGKLFDLDGTMINKILCILEYQVKLASCKYTPTKKAKFLCNTNTLASGKYKGIEIITSWNWDDNKAFREHVIKHVEIYKAELLAQKQSHHDNNIF